jgi:N-acetylglucosaminyldiphosphoundecaprenol N-acetyl-beta-D-mannosaminyltransferase
VDASSYADATERILHWSRSSSGRYVCVANVHMTMEAVDDEGFRDLVNGADLVVPDGMPLVWSLRRLGVPGAGRVYGPTLTLRLCRAAAEAGVPIGLYGGRPEAIVRLRANLEAWFPGLRIAYAASPPFRALSEAEDADVVDAIAASGARVLFVGLGCPKQERWMLAHRERLPLVQVGVGAAFDFHAGLVRQAPSWLQDAGLEWAFRFAMEPRRLARRYLRQNPRFVIRLARQLWSSRFEVQEARAHD